MSYQEYVRSRLGFPNSGVVPKNLFLRIIKSVTSKLMAMTIILIFMVMVIMMVMIKVKMISPVYQRERKGPSGLRFSI